MPTFSVIIISYNGKDFLRRSLATVLKDKVAPEQIIVVDDFSDDDTETMIKREFPAVQYTRNEKNLGPAASRNRGAQLAKNDNLVFLDNDILVRPNAIGDLVKFLETDQRFGIVSAKLISGSGDRLWWNVGHNPNHLRDSMGYLMGFFIKFFPKSQLLRKISKLFTFNYCECNSPMEVSWAMECFFAVKKKVFDAVGGFDEKYFMFFEGPDLSFRLRKLGYKTYFYPKSEADVLEGHTHSKNRNKIFLRAKYRFYKKHYFYLKSNPILFLVGKLISSLFYLLA